MVVMYCHALSIVYCTCDYVLVFTEYCSDTCDQIGVYTNFKFRLQIYLLLSVWPFIPVSKCIVDCCL